MFPLTSILVALISRIYALLQFLPLSPMLPLAKGTTFPEIVSPIDDLNVLLELLYSIFTFAPDISKPAPSA